jgi:hypothetical protein
LNGDCSAGKFYYCKGSSTSWGAHTPAVKVYCIKDNATY